MHSSGLAYEKISSRTSNSRHLRREQAGLEMMSCVN
jgi:hypothetical protein